MNKRVKILFLNSDKEFIFASDDIIILHKDILTLKQDCIPVGCVPPTAVAIRGVSTGHPLGAGTPPDQAPPLDQAPPGPGIPRPGTPGAGTPPTRHPLDQVPPQTRHHPGAGTPQTKHPPPVDRHMPVNVLFCPKLRLRAVNIIQARGTNKLFELHCFGK